MCVFVITEIMVVHKELQSAGKQPGLQIWRVENMNPVPVPKQLYGNFYTGDAYLLLYTTPAPAYTIHMWLGETLSLSLSVCPHIQYVLCLLYQDNCINEQTYRCSC